MIRPVEQKSEKTIIIGLDGVPVGMIEKLVAQGIMPHIGRLIGEGQFGPMESTIPEVSSVAWSTMITGVNPGQHGIYGFTDLFSGSYQVRYPCYRDLQVAPFWENHSAPSVILNVPGTYPVREMNGVHVAGFVALDLARSVYPSDLLAILQEMDYRLDVDSQKAHQSMDLFWADLEKTHRARIQAWRHLWTKQPWQTFMLVFTGTDRLLHFLWDAWEDTGHKYHQRFLDYFHSIDQVVGEIAATLVPDDRLIMLSDHGFERLDWNVYVNFHLQQAGLLRFRTSPPGSLKDIDPSSKAFALDPGRIYVHAQGRFPGGTIEPDAVPGVVEEVEKVFDSLRIDGRKVVRRMCRRDDIYHGPCVESAPDLVLVAAEGFNLKANLKAASLSGRDAFTGKHTQDTAFCLLRGFIPAPQPRFSIQEVASIMKSPHLEPSSLGSR